ncbi:MAG: LPS export ABC transporter periplasmic protein LptC [Magnetococcus sp. XQGC-1]
MKTPVKLTFIALPLLVIGTVSWHLQHPPQLTPGETPCQPVVADAHPRTENDGCKTAQDTAQYRSTGTLVTAIHLVQFDGETPQWLLKAPTAHNDNEERILIREPDLTIYEKDGQRSSITSLEGLVDNRTQAIVFTGDVRVNNGAQRLTTEILRFEPGTKQLYTNREFVLVDEQMRLEGFGLTLYQETQKMVVPERVKVHFPTIQEGACRETGLAPRHA